MIIFTDISNMRRRFIHQEEAGENFCKIILTIKAASFSVPLYGEQFDSSQFSYIKIDNKQHDINLRDIYLSVGEHTIEYGFNTLINGDDFLSGGGEVLQIDVIEFNVDTSETVSMARMFVGINSIINLDHINISNVKSMEYMFGNSLIVESPFTRLHDTLYENCYSAMYLGCANLTTAPELPATTLTKGCYSSMFSQCTSLTSAPELPATTLIDSCYDNMFYNCSKLNYIKALFTTTPSSTYTSYWVDGVSPKGTFVKNPEATWESYGNDSIPNGWKVVMDGEEDEGTYDEVFGEIPPESTEFGWPLYITVPHFDTKEYFRSYYKQPSDIGLQLYNWIMENYEEEQDPWGGGCCTSYPPELYINGEKIEFCYWDVFFGQVQNYPTFNTTKISDGTVTEEGAIYINVFIG